MIGFWKCSNWKRINLKIFGTSGIRTQNFQLGAEVLYPLGHGDEDKRYRIIHGFIQTT